MGRARAHPGVPPPPQAAAAATHGDASIVFIISMSMRKIRELEGGYSASKAAVQTAAKTMAVELGPTGDPGELRRAGLDRRARTSRRSSGWTPRPATSTPDVVRGEIEARIPLGLIPPQDDIANAVVFFASPWSRVITGQTLDVNGGEWIG